MSEFEGLKAIVTGGAEGIGRATANLMQALDVDGGVTRLRVRPRK